MKQNYNNYTAEDMAVWKTLFERQEKNLKNKSCSAYLDCLAQLKEVLNADFIPRFDRLNERLFNKTGWTVEVVPGLIPVEQFFELLAQKKFCSSTWLRSMEQLDYLEEPDMFHDIFGHIPLFMNEGYANFAHQMGLLGIQHLNNPTILEQLQRIYWFTIEFGLVQEHGLKIYGAGIISSFGESNFVYSHKPEILPYNLEQIVNTSFCNSEIQSKYFELPNFEILFDIIEDYTNTLIEQVKLKA